MKASPPHNTIRTSTTVMVLFVLMVLTLAVYAQVHRFGFVNFDDDVHVYENSNVSSGLSMENVIWAFGIHGPSQWHPLAWISHQLDCEFFDLWPGGHHLTNLALHVACVAVLFLFLVRVTRCLWKSAFVAAIFAVHPLNVESVAWVSERRNVLALFFGLLTVAAYGSYARQRTFLRYVPVFVLFAMALMSKPLVVTLPFVMLLLDYWPLRSVGNHLTDHGARSDITESTVSLSRLILEKVPLLLLSVGASVLTIWCQAGIIATPAALSVRVRILNALAVLPAYLLKIVWPAGLGAFYPHPGFVSDQPESDLLLPALIGSSILVVVTLWVVLRRRQAPYLAVGWFWYIGTLIPMIGLIQSGQQQMADRYMFLPMIGLVLSVAWFIPECCRTVNVHPSWLRLAAAGTVLACACGTWVQTGYWQNSVTLFEHTLAVTERNTWAHNNLGLALMNRGFTLQAGAHFSEALEIDPEYGLAHYNLGVVLHKQRKLPQAVSYFQEAVRLTPDHIAAYLRLGVAFADMGELNQAVTSFTEAVRRAPQSPGSTSKSGNRIDAVGQSGER